jgi:[acyl-carrier-protein] S-malonyltransferase
MSTAFLFSGQGSQYVGMAKELNSEYPQVTELIAKADSVLGFAISSIMFNGPEESLRETRYTQPALFVHEMAILSVLGDSIKPSAVAGHSLGEYSALVCAGVLSFESALKIVALRGALMFEAGTQEPGAMAAIIGLDDEVVIELCAKLSGEQGVIVPANFNSPGQLVISGNAELLRSSLGEFKSAGARMVTELPVSGAFHSPLMKPAQQELATAINNTEFAPATTDVYCNVTGTSERDGTTLRNNLIEQLVSPVLWTQTLKSMQSQGITDFVEIGPKNVLQGLVKRTLQGIVIKGIDTAEQVRAFQEQVS